MNYNNKRKINTNYYENDFKRARYLENCLEQIKYDYNKLKNVINDLKVKNNKLEELLDNKNNRIFNLDKNLIKFKEYKIILGNIETNELFKIFSIKYIEGERYVSCLIYKFIKEERKEDIDKFNKIKELCNKLDNKKILNEDNSNNSNDVENNIIENTAIDSDHWTKNKLKNANYLFIIKN